MSQRRRVRREPRPMWIARAMARVRIAEDLDIVIGAGEIRRRVDYRLRHVLVEISSKSSHRPLDLLGDLTRKTCIAWTARPSIRTVVGP
jgi:hypothetical protein